MEIVVISGKGGTGKTTIAAALSELAQDVTRVDCDVDASNFYLYYSGENLQSEDFYGGKNAVVDYDKCTQCGKCELVCRFDAISNFKIDAFACEGCGACALVCPQRAINLKDEKAAEAYITQLDQGIISRAEVEIGSDGSGQLITLLRKKAKDFFKEEKFTIIDGSPGIGCPVIASITGSNAVLIVTEPTQSGLDDLKRIVALCEHFKVFTMVCINKFDINEDMSKNIQSFVEAKQLNLIGKIPYDNMVIRSVNELKPIINYEESSAGKAVRDMWLKIREATNQRVE